MQRDQISRVQIHPDRGRVYPLDRDLVAIYTSDYATAVRDVPVLDLIAYVQNIAPCMASRAKTVTTAAARIAATLFVRSFMSFP